MVHAFLTVSPGRSLKTYFILVISVTSALQTKGLLPFSIIPIYGIASRPESGAADVANILWQPLLSIFLEGWPRSWTLLLHIAIQQLPSPSTVWPQSTAASWSCLHWALGVVHQFAYWILTDWGHRLSAVSLLAGHGFVVAIASVHIPSYKLHWAAVRMSAIDTLISSLESLWCKHFFSNIHTASNPPCQQLTFSQLQL